MIAVSVSVSLCEPCVVDSMGHILLMSSFLSDSVFLPFPLFVTLHIVLNFHSGTSSTSPIFRPLFSISLQSSQPTSIAHLLCVSHDGKH